MNQNILVIGQGGREHAIAWKISKSPNVSNVYVCPGNGGTELDSSLLNVNLNINDHDSLVNFAKQNNITMTIVGPENPLAAGIVNSFLNAGLKIFGPKKQYALLESSKVFSKEFMKNFNIPTSEYQMFSSNQEAKDFCSTKKHPIVIKADGLAAGKGVVVSASIDESYEAIDSLLKSEHSDYIVVEEFLNGQELSAIYIVNYQGISYEIGLPWTKDYKSRDEYNSGPNTGGMGAVSHPLSFENKNSLFKLHLDIEKILIKTLTSINNYNKDDGVGYLGFLYMGLMINNKDEINVLEYNCRLGDPETQNIMLTLHNKDVDLLDLILGRKNNKKDFNLDRIDNEDNGYCCTLVLAAKGYPESYKKGFYLDLSSIKETDQLVIFHSGTDIENGKIVSKGGRILSVNVYANDRQKAIDMAYEKIKEIKVFEDKDFKHQNQDLVFFREDIGN